MYIKESFRYILHRQFNLNNSYFLNTTTQVSKQRFVNVQNKVKNFSLSIMQNFISREQKKIVLLKSKLRMAQHYRVNVLKLFINGFMRTPISFKDQSVNLLRLWTHQCECVIAQRVRRGQQMFSLYSRMWEERALKEVFSRVRQQMVNHGKKLLISATGISAFNWDLERISDKEILQYSNEIDNIHSLTIDTITCNVCGKRKKIDCEVPNISYCKCPINKIVVNPSTKIDWAPFIERQDILIWRKEETVGNFIYKCYGSYNDVNAKDFLQVQIDIQYRKTWDISAVDLKVIESDPNSNSDVIYWEMKWPRFFSNRDYVFNRRYVIDKEKNQIIIVNKGINHPTCPNKNSSIRVDEYWSFMVIRPYTNFNEPGIEFGLTYYDNPGVTLPETVRSWVAAQGMPDFLARMRAASKSYNEYLKNNKSQVSDREDHTISESNFKQTVESRNEKLENFNKETSVKNSDSKLRQSKEPDDDKEFSDTLKAPEKIPTNNSSTPGTEVFTAPSAIISQEIEKPSRSYWRYLHPLSYFY